jgi:hypothetical protein
MRLPPFTCSLALAAALQRGTRGFRHAIQVVANHPSCVPMVLLSNFHHHGSPEHAR